MPKRAVRAKKGGRLPSQPHTKYHSQAMSYEQVFEHRPMTLLPSFTYTPVPTVYSNKRRTEEADTALTPCCGRRPGFLRSRANSTIWHNRHYTEGFKSEDQPANMRMALKDDAQGVLAALSPVPANPQRGIRPTHQCNQCSHDPRRSIRFSWNFFSGVSGI